MRWQGGLLNCRHSLPSSSRNFELPGIGLEGCRCVLGAGA